MEIYQRIKALREEKGLSQEELARLLGYKDRSTIAKIERGINDITQSKIVAFAKALDTTPAFLMGWEDSQPSTRPNDFDGLPDNCLPIKMKTVPLIGTIACGSPIWAEENFCENVSMPDHIRADFALRCKGDSMLGTKVQIHDGDIVYIRTQPDVDNGQIAAVLIDNEATLKRVYKKENQLILRPENPDYEPLVYAGQELEYIRILGKAVAYMSVI